MKGLADSGYNYNDEQQRKLVRLSDISGIVLSPSSQQTICSSLFHVHKLLLVVYSSLASKYALVAVVALAVESVDQGSRWELLFRQTDPDDDLVCIVAVL